MNKSHTEVTDLLKGKKVLIADDDEYSCAIAKNLLTKIWIASENISVVGDGEAAIEITAKELFDLILMDIRMPIIDGVEAAKQIRLRDKQNAPKIVAYTANDSHQGISGINLMDAVMVKPGDNKKFKEMVKEILQDELTESSDTLQNHPATVEI